MNITETLTIAKSDMTVNGIAQLVLFVGLLTALVKPLGWYMARVLEGAPGHAPLGGGRVLGRLELAIYAAAGLRRTADGRVEEQGWKPYAWSVLVFSFLGLIAVYVLQRAQHLLPANPSQLGPVESGSAVNTAISFVTNTNWQGYGGEVTMSSLTQMLGLTVQNFVSAATGVAVLAALIRGLARRSSATIGNFWVDLTRSTLYILLPLSFLLAVALVSQGVVQSFSEPVTATLTVPQAVSVSAGASGQTEVVRVAEQVIPRGPVASQVAIKQLGTNGGGFFNTNAAHPLENPTAISDLLQVLAILLLPAALCWTFGELVRDRRQGWAVYVAMLVIFVPCLVVNYAVEQAGNPRITAIADLNDEASETAPGGNMEGKESRFGIASSVRWAAATTAASNGSVNSMHDSYTPLGGLIPMWLMQLGEVVFGGIGSGLYGMLMFVIVAVFVAGLMVGRAPEYLGKKIEPFEMKMAAVCILVPCAIVLCGAALAATIPQGATTSNPGPHAFSQILYAFSSAANNNGSAFAGLSANTPFYNTALGLAMWFSRFWIIIPVLAVAGSMASKRTTPSTSGTLPTHTPVFVLMLTAVVLIVGALTFVPALALGPIAEHLQLAGR